MRSPNLVLTAALVGVLGPLPFLGAARADGVANRSDVIAVADIKPGMRGHGLTVFQGYAPERFDVEVIDVLPNFRPRQDLILIKTRHPRLDVTKIVAGMSGSPIYLGGKMAGAYAYGWTFGSEPVAGVTPIRNMLDDLARPLPDAIDGWPLRPLPPRSARATVEERGRSAKTTGRLPARTSERVAGASGRRFQGRITEYDVREHTREVALANVSAATFGTPALTPVATPLSVGGMTPGAFALATELLTPLGLEPLQAGGSGTIDPQAPTRYVDGGAIGVDLLAGDISMSGLGTVTRVEGDKLVAFGHPMMEAGATALPTSVGRIAWLMASEMRSFKVGAPARPVGSLVNDRQASIVVSHGTKSPTVPVTMTIRGATGAPTPQWKFSAAHEKLMTPMLVAIALGSALQTTAGERQDVSWNLKTKVRVRGHGELVIEDYGVAVGGTPQPGEFLRSNVVRGLGMLLNNPWEPVIIEAVDAAIELRYAREMYRLRGLELLDTELEPGQPARLRLTLEPWAGPPISRVISVPIPESLEGETLRLEVTPGYMQSRDRPAPENLAMLVANLQDPVYPAKTIVVGFTKNSASVAYRTHVAENLPPGALDALRPTTTSIVPEAFRTEVRHVVPIEQFMVGKDAVSVEVKRVRR
ncbi:MAG: hypothetical protein JW751_11585 [Polyangiaceae bacterium]|nr:hypothetical protein [Polyangiaceae bacterium]